MPLHYRHSRAYRDMPLKVNARISLFSSAFRTARRHFSLYLYYLMMRAIMPQMPNTCLIIPFHFTSWGERARKVNYFGLLAEDTMLFLYLATPIRARQYQKSRAAAATLILFCRPATSYSESWDAPMLDERYTFSEDIGRAHYTSWRALFLSRHRFITASCCRCRDCRW